MISVLQMVKVMVSKHLQLTSRS